MNVILVKLSIRILLRLDKKEKMKFIIHNSYSIFLCPKIVLVLAHISQENRRKEKGFVLFLIGYFTRLIQLRFFFNTPNCDQVFVPNKPNKKKKLSFYTKIIVDTLLVNLVINDTSVVFIFPERQLL